MYMPRKNTGRMYMKMLHSVFELWAKSIFSHLFVFYISHNEYVLFFDKKNLV